MQDTLEDRYSIYHEAITFTNAFANCGTSSDKFLRENLDWLGRASNWAKFSTTAALGLIHRRSWRNGARIVKPYLPGGSAPNVFSEGGALFALGLIYVGHREGCEADLRKGLAEGNDVAVQHGAALGLGVSGIASADEALYEEIRNVLFHDNATAGEAAGYAMGMVMLGTASKKAHEEMISYTRETQHEKIIRSLAVGAAFLQYGAREEADPVIDSMLEEKVRNLSSLETELISRRTQFCDTVACSPLRWHTLEPATIARSEGCSMLPFQTSTTMSDVQL